MHPFKTLVEQYLSHCKYEKNLSPLSLKSYRLDIEQFERFIGNRTGLNELDKDTMKGYLRHLYESKLKESSIRRKMISLKALFSYLEQEDKISASPFMKLRLSIRIPRTIPQVMNLHEIKTLLNLPKIKFENLKACKLEDARLDQIKTRKDFFLLQDIVILELLFITGMRISELSKLNLYDIDWERKVITVKGKGARERLVPIACNKIEKLLSFFVSARPPEHNEDPLLISNRNTRMGSQSIRGVVARYVTLSKLQKRITPHTFRHTTATLLLENGTDIRIVQCLLGHSSITMTQHYTHVSELAQRKIITLNHPRNFM